MSSNLLPDFTAFYPPLIFSFFTLSLTDFPSEWSSGRRHPADSSGQEPGQEG